MKTLLLLRHSKSEELYLSKSDFERNLSEQGLLDIQKVKKYYFSKYPYPDLILSSSANRTNKSITCNIKNILQLRNIEEANTIKINIVRRESNIGIS
jgi:phosphohistidine phosphatase